MTAAVLAYATGFDLGLGAAMVAASVIGIALSWSRGL